MNELERSWARAVPPPDFEDVLRRARPTGARPRSRAVWRLAPAVALVSVLALARLPGVLDSNRPELPVVWLSPALSNPFGDAGSDLFPQSPLVVANPFPFEETEPVSPPANPFCLTLLETNPFTPEGGEAAPGDDPRRF